MSSQELQEDRERARVWLKPDQIEQLRDAALSTGAKYLRARNDVIVATLAELGLRVGELVALDVDDFDLDERELFLPTEKQKDYPIEGKSPPPKYYDLSGDLNRDLRRYLDGRWRDSEALLPSRESDRMSTEQVRNVIHSLALEADVRPYLESGGRGIPIDVTPHTLRHSVAYRMLRVEGARLVDVRDHLRHTRIATTEAIYEHFAR